MKNHITIIYVGLCLRAGKNDSAFQFKGIYEGREITSVIVDSRGLYGVEFEKGQEYIICLQVTDQRGLTLYGNALKVKTLESEVVA